MNASENESNIKELKVSVVMPVFNGANILQESLESLFRQSEYFHELIVIDDASTDNSAEIVANLIGGETNYRLIENKKNLGLAGSYNIGIKAARHDLIITMHQDIVLTENALRDLVDPLRDEKFVASGHSDIHPADLWKNYNFWQKCFFARFSKLETVGINGQFDCFRKSAFAEAGLFDSRHFRTAGEDTDIVYKLKKIGRIAESRAKTIHIHGKNVNFGWQYIVRKQAQYSEAQGALLRLREIGNFSEGAKIFFREILILALLIPFVNILAIVAIISYSFAYTKQVYIEEYKNPRIFVLPFFNIYLLFVSLFYSLRGFLHGKQRI